MQSHNNAKEWAKRRRAKKHAHSRDCRKSNANGSTLRRTDTSRASVDATAGFSTERFVSYKETISQYPNPVERYFGKRNPKAGEIHSNLADIIEKTDPTEILSSPPGKRDQHFSRGDDSLSLVYQYSETEKEYAAIWQLRKKAQLSKRGKEIPQLIEIIDAQQKRTQHRNAFKPPLIHESSLRFAVDCCETENSTSNNRLLDYMTLDFGNNKWMTGLTTIYRWYFVRDRNTGKKIWLLSSVGRYKVYIAVDESEKDRNFSKFHSKTHKNDDTNESNDSDNQKRVKVTKHKSKRDGYSNKHCRKQSKASKKPTNVDKRKWELLGSFTGDLEGYYVNLNAPFTVKKTYRLGSNQSNPNYNTAQIGKLVRWVKIVPHNKSDYYFGGLEVFGCNVDLLSKPMLHNPLITNPETESQSMIEEKRTEYDWENAPIHIGPHSRVSDNSDGESGLVSIGVSRKLATHWSRRVDFPQSGYKNYYFLRTIKERKQANNNYMAYVKRFPYDEPSVVS